MIIYSGLALACFALLQSLPVAAQLASTGSGQAWPTKPVRFIVGFPPGGSTDLVARYMAEPLSPLLGKQVLVDNRGGANGAMGAAIAARSAPDGYNFLVVYNMRALAVTALTRVTQLLDIPPVAEQGFPGY